jgi:hypothetical protein
MKERPILFSAPMVRAILAATKTQTRRVLKPQPSEHHWELLQGHQLKASAPVACVDGKMHVRFWHSIPQNTVWDKAGDASCPYGQPGDRLWVRETWFPDPPCDGTWGYTAWAGCRIGQIAGVPERFRKPRHCIYAADWKGIPLRWTPAIHMPRWASRITLEITSVRVERLLDISEADAIAEGCTQNHNGYFWGGPHSVSGLKQMATAKQAYQDLWKSINGPESWEANPWVWVVEFKEIA